MWRAAAPLGLGLVLFLLPVPSGLEPNAWRYFALFAAVILGLILEPIPAAAIGLVGVTLAGVGRPVERAGRIRQLGALGVQDRTVG